MPPVIFNPMFLLGKNSRVKRARSREVQDKDALRLREIRAVAQGEQKIA
jgi:hypothetical protein